MTPDPRTPPPAARLRGLRRASVLGVVVPVAETPLSRLLGLAHLDRGRAGPGLLLDPCSAVHTFGMRFDLDLLFLDGDGRLVRVERHVGPRRFVSERRAAAVLELPVGGSPGGGAEGCGVVGGVHP